MLGLNGPSIFFMYVDHFGNTLAAFDKNNQQHIYDAYQLGYRVSEDGKLYGIRLARSLPAKPGRFGYPRFRIRLNDGRFYQISAHRLAAFCFWGFAAFKPGILVRHLSSKCDFSKGALALGTAHDNMMDIPAHIRRARSVKARAAQGVSSFRAKLTPQQVRRVRAFYAALPGLRFGNGKVQALERELGVTRQTFHGIVHGKLYRHVD